LDPELDPDPLLRGTDPAPKCHGSPTLISDTRSPRSDSVADIHLDTGQVGWTRIGACRISDSSNFEIKVLKTFSARCISQYGA
jgi:hypothetical protein